MFEQRRSNFIVSIVLTICLVQALPSGFGDILFFIGLLVFLFFLGICIYLAKLEEKSVSFGESGEKIDKIALQKFANKTKISIEGDFRGYRLLIYKVGGKHPCTCFKLILLWYFKSSPRFKG